MEHEEVRDQKPFIEHLLELRRRLFYVALALLGGASIGFSVNEHLQDFLISPLGQKLYYTSPLGGFDFIFRISLFAGFLAAIPVFVYNLLKFIEPSIGTRKTGSILKIVGSSIGLLAVGVAFGYYISLPAVLGFLTGFTTDNISALISTTEYLPFVTLYLLAFGLIFQIPLIFFIINRIRPINPQKLKSSQKYVITGSFILAALISPTPDILNQVIMALPIIVLYELSLVTLFLWNRNKPTGMSLPTDLPFLPNESHGEKAPQDQPVPQETRQETTPKPTRFIDTIRPATPLHLASQEDAPMAQSSLPTVLPHEHLLDLRTNDSDMAPAPWIEEPLQDKVSQLNSPSVLANNHVSWLTPGEELDQTTVLNSFEQIDESLQPHRLDLAS